MANYEFIDIFDLTRPTFKIKNEIRLIELFAGYGSQALALKYLGVNFTHHKTCEWAIKSIQAYNDLHIKDYTDYSQLLNEEQVKNFLFKKGISANYNEPMTKTQIDRLSEKQARTIYNNIIATHNLVNIQQVHANDLDIHDTYLLTYLLTYSFPCQDLSLAGNGKGMGRESGTRSGMLWEVERILKECKELPQILLMENVPQVHSQDNVQDFNNWQLFLESLGYCNYWEDLNAKDYGIPQNRNRTFMISILGDYNYKFPQAVPLKLKLKDMLEQNVDEKYYLSDKMLNYIIANNEKWTGNNDKSIINKSIASTINTGEGSRRCDASNYICDELDDDINIKEELNLYNLGIKRYNRRTRVVLNPNGLMTTLLARTQGDNSMIIVKHSYTQQIMSGNKKCVEKNDGTMITLTTRGDTVGIVVKDTPNYIEWEEKGKLDIDCRAWKENAIAPTTTTPKNKVLLNNLRIRKLTPKECWRLMGVRDADYEKVAKNQSNASLYHLAGDSIVVNVLMAIFKQLL